MVRQHKLRWSYFGEKKLNSMSYKVFGSRQKKLGKAISCRKKLNLMSYRVFGSRRWGWQYLGGKKLSPCRRSWTCRDLRVQKKLPL